MAETLLLGLTKSVTEKVGSFVAGEVDLAWNQKKELNKLNNSLIAINAVLQDAEKKQIGDNSIRNWLKDLKDVVYEIDDLLDSVAIDTLRKKISKGFFKKVSFYVSHINFLLDYCREIRSIRERLDEIATLKKDFQLDVHPVDAKDSYHTAKTYSFANEVEIIGREKPKEEIIEYLLRIVNESFEGLPVLPIVGIGGLGKTAVAKLVYGDERIDQLFDMKVWACSSEKFDMKMIIEDIIESATGESKSNLQLEQLQKKLRNILRGRRCFLVLDNMWIEDVNQWSELRALLASATTKGSIVLATTRSTKVASIVETIGRYYLPDLLPEDRWSIFSKCVFREGEEKMYPQLVEIGKLIVDKCGGLPLALKTIGGLLRFERDRATWQQILENELWKIDQEGAGIFAALKLSYDAIPSHIKPCFVYCSMFPKGRNLTRVELIAMWMAQGFLHLSYKGEELEDVGDKYYMELLSRSLFQDVVFDDDGSVIGCKMHDLAHDLAVSIAREEQAFVRSGKDLENAKRARHIAWEEVVLSGKEFSQKQLSQAAGLRTFMFRYIMRQVSKSSLEGLISSFNCLRVLDLRESQFEELPSSVGKLKHLRCLSLGWNGSLKALPSSVCELLNLQSLFLIGCSQFGELPRDIDKLVSLRLMGLTSSKMTSLPEKGLHGLTALRYLDLYCCAELRSLSEGMGHLIALHHLLIQNCPKLTSLPNSMKVLTALESLIIADCEVLDLTQGEGMTGLKGLKYLNIDGLPKFEDLPGGFMSGSSASLRYLIIRNCPSLRRLPDCLQHFASLEKIVIQGCPNFLGLPEWLPSLPSLQQVIM